VRRMMKALPPSERTRIKRLPERGSYDRETVYSILDEGRVCHVGIAAGGRPVVIPMAYARLADRLILHGSGGSRLMKALIGGADVCVAVTLLDALVLARSAFHHSMNYRSVVVFGRTRPIRGEDEKLAAFRGFFEHVLPGRWEDVRKPSQKELAQTALKVRTGPPVDDEEDYELPVWAGLLPFEFGPKAAVSDPRLKTGVDKPDYLEAISRGSKD
jgi:nitroimidazol reductase NimA-like FMN-containing flavoprotein (pyridoxamine 5'-phosphate oxidase superfamily)